MTKEKNIAFVVSSPTTLIWLGSLINKLALEYNVSVVANFDDDLPIDSKFLDEIEIVNIPIVREISISKDLKSLILLFKFFSSKDFLIVHSITPKAGFIAMFASWAARIPIRIHTFTGQVWYTRLGLFRLFLKLIDRLIVYLATVILIDSHSQKKFLEEENVVSEKNSFVVGEGSISGVDTTRFCRDLSVRERVRSEMGAKEKIVILYVGRLKKDKGILDLIESFKVLRGKGLKVDLWIVGPDEEDLTSRISSVEGIKQIPYTSKPESYMASADIFCLPSYREGFGNVVIESAACGLPSVVNCIYGLTDAVVQGKTGLFAKARSVESLTISIEELITNDNLRLELGNNALERVRKYFSQDVHNNLQIDMYIKLIDQYSKGS